MATIKAGTYRFNDALIIDTAIPSQDIYFEVNDTLVISEEQAAEYNGILGEYGDVIATTYSTTVTCSFMGPTYDDITLGYKKTEAVTSPISFGLSLLLSTNSGENGEITTAYNNAWACNAYQTITILSDSGVSDEFYAWFTANAAEVVEDTEETPVATIIYGGSVIASLNEGQTATLKCAGMKMESDVVVEVAEQTESTPPNIQPLTITENGTYTAEDGVDGYSPITVEVESGGEGEPLDLCIEGGRAEVNLPNATKIKKYAFKADLTLVNITMPKVTSIGADAFYYCSNLVLTSLPSGLTSMGDNAFRYCSKLALTSLPNGLTSIPSNAFNDDKKLAITEIPISVTSIGDSAFSYCSGLTSLTFKGTPTSISSCFYQCVNLKTINVPWAEGEVSGAPWGATNATINYNYTGG